MNIIQRARQRTAGREDPKLDYCSSNYKRHMVLTAEELRALRAKRAAFANRNAGGPARIQSELTEWPVANFQMEQVWTYATGDGIDVGVVDGGWDTNHPDLTGQVVAAADFTGDGIEDTLGHGTHVAGIIGAARNSSGNAGIAYDCNLHISRATDNNGNGSQTEISNAIQWCIDQNVDVMNISLGNVAMANPTMVEKIYSALSAGIVVVVAAGNDGDKRRINQEYPGFFGGVITVGSHDSDGETSGFSSPGGGIDFLGPGQSILSTAPGGGFGISTGTSMAAPWVSGIVALLMEFHSGSPHGITIDSTEAARVELMKMAASAGSHSEERGYGPLWPLGYFQSF